MSFAAPCSRCDSSLLVLCLPLLLLQGIPSAGRRAELFAAYVEALRQVAAQRMAKAEAAVTDLLVKLNVGPESSWGEVRVFVLACCLLVGAHISRLGGQGDKLVM